MTDVYIGSLDELHHYGVKGMKWGVRNSERPSGAKPSRQEARQGRREARGQKQDAMAAAFNTKISEIDNGSFKNKRAEKSALKDREKLVKQRDRAVKDAGRVREGKLTIKQRNVVIGVSAVAAIVAANEVYKFQDSGEFRRLREIGKAKAQGRDATKEFIFKKKDGLSGPMSEADIMEKVVKGVNPDFGAYGTKSNCRRATFAYEMRRRGYDVEATKSKSGAGQAVGGMYNALNPGSRMIGYDVRGGAAAAGREIPNKIKRRPTPFLDFVESGSTGTGRTKRVKPDTQFSDPDVAQPLGIFKALREQPNGARGELGVQWKGGSAHSMAWEIVNNRPVIFDAQTGKRYSDIAEFFPVGSRVKNADITRLDDLELNPDQLLRWMQDARP